MLIPVREIMETLGHGESVKLALKALKSTAERQGMSRHYNLDAVRAEVARIEREKQKPDDGRWQPSHPGPWTNEDFAEFNRRHPFRRECLTQLCNELCASKNHRT